MSGNPILQRAANLGSGKIEACKEKFRRSRREILGVFFAEGQISLALLREEGAHCRFSALAQLPIDEAVRQNDARVQAAESIEVFLAKEGAASAEIVLAMPREKLFWIAESLPEISTAEGCVGEPSGDLAGELSNMVHYELQSRGFFREAFSSAYQKSGERTLMAGIATADLERERRAWQAEGIMLRGAAARPEEVAIDPIAGGIGIGETVIPLGEGARLLWDRGVAEATYAAYAAMEARGIFFPLTETGTRWRFKTLGIAWIGAVLSALFLCFCYEGGGLYLSDRGLDEQRQEIALRMEEFAKMQEFRAREGAVRKSMGDLARLSKDGVSLYAILVHLGMKTEEGIYFTALHLYAKEQLEIFGHAASYAALGELLQEFSQQRDLFPAGAELAEAVREEGGVRFLLRISLREKGKEDGL